MAKIGLAYAGVAVGAKDKLVHKFQNEAGEDFYFAKSQFVQIGEVYEAELDPKDGKLTMHRRPALFKNGKKPSAEVIGKWERASLAAEERARQIRAAKAPTRFQKDLDRLVEQLNHAIGAASYSDREHIASYVAREIRRGAK